MANNMTRRSFLTASAVFALGGYSGSFSGGLRSVGSSSSSDESPVVGTNPAKGITEVSDEPMPVEIIESGYHITKDGFVMIGIVWKNPNTKYEVQFPTVTITGKDEEGKIVFSTKQVMPSLLPGEQQQFGMQAGNGTAPATVEFGIVDGDTQYTKTSEQPQEWLTITNINEVFDDLFTSYTGEMITNSDEAADYSKAWVSVILRDEDDAIVYGYNNFVDIAANGSSSAFEIMVLSDLPEHASYELSATPWF